MLCGHGADVRFFYGRQGEPLFSRTGVITRGDEIELPVDDAYFQLVYKDVAMFGWALDNGYDFIFKIDADTWLDVQKLLKADFEQHDWVGLMGDKGASGGVGHCTSGGVGIWLSAKAMRTFLNHYPKMPGGKFHLFEDWALSLTLAAAGMKPVNSDLLWNYDLGPRTEEEKNNLISWHGWTPDVAHVEQRGGGDSPWKP
jgi:Galactosyltransferase